MKPGFWTRLNPFAVPRTNGNGHKATDDAGSSVALAIPGTERKAGEISGVTLIDTRPVLNADLPPDVQFYSPDHTRTIYQVIGGASSEAERVNRSTAFAAAAYCFAAMRYRARAFSEPPLMVVNEDSKGVEKWIANHPLDEVLDYPSDDFDMGEMLTKMLYYQDITGHALWKKEIGGLNNLAGFQLFAGGEFEVESTERRLRGQFKLVDTSRGDVTIPAEQAIYFHEVSPYSWHQGQSLVDVVLGWLNLGQTSRAAVQDILRNSLFPSIIVTNDKDWHPDDDEWEQHKAELDAHAQRAARGKPLSLTGGGTATRVSLTLKELIPSDILDRVETVVSAVFGVAAVILQYEVGLKNSPWSQMSEARKMTYQDTIAPLWTRAEKTLTRQLLRAPLKPGGTPLDDNRRHKIRFDKSDIEALKPDRAALVTMASQMGDDASLNERREVMGLEPLADDEANIVPALDKLQNPVIPPMLPGADPNADPDADEDAEDAPEPPTKRQHKDDRRINRLKVFDAGTRAIEGMWMSECAVQLASDRHYIMVMANNTLRTAKANKAGPVDPDSVDDLIRKIMADRQMASAWKDRIHGPTSTTADNAVHALSEEIGVSFRLLQPGLSEYVNKEAAWLVKNVTDTTKQTIRDALRVGLEAGEGIDKLTKRISDSGAFQTSRATLIARTETTRVTNGAQRSQLASYAKREQKTATKEWLATDDDKVRDEHWELNGTIIGINEAFDNGLTEPSEPNCRCTLIYSVG